MYWYNPKTRSSERAAAPSTDEQAIRMLAGHADSATFVSEYARLRRSRMEIETALTLVGHEVRLRHHERLAAHGLRASHDRRSGSRVRAGGYEPLSAVRPAEMGREEVGTEGRRLARGRQRA